MPRTPLTPDRVVDSAIDLLGREGPEGLTLGSVARELGVRTPSLYNHIASLDDLHRRITLRSLGMLQRRLADAVAGRSGPRALHALADALRGFAREHPHLYPFTIRRWPDDDDVSAASDASTRVALRALRHWYPKAGDPGEAVSGDAVHAARALRATVHGFVDLERQDGFGLPVDVDESFRRAVDMSIQALGAPARDIRTV